MAVYVDALVPCLTNARWRYNQACHLFADDEAELHQFAQAIGLNRSWFQRSRRLPHYDLTAGKRRQAVRHGAMEVDRRFVRDYMARSEKPFPSLFGLPVSITDHCEALGDAGDIVLGDFSQYLRKGDGS